MSDDETSNTPATRDRREAVREKAQQVHAQQRRSRLIRRVSVAAAVVVAVGAIAGVVAWTFTSAASKPLLSPANMQNDGVVVEVISGGTFGNAAATAVDADAASAAPTAEPTEEPAPEETADPEATEAAVGAMDIRVYLDYMSPDAAAFQLANAGQLSQWVTDGAATLSYHPVALLSAKSNGTKYSLRAANASACVASHAPDTFFAYNHELLAKQPAQNSPGYTDAELADLAQASGIANPKVVRACIENEDFAPWAKDATERALSEALPGTDDTSLTGTVMVLVNGQPYVGALGNAKEFAQFVLTVSSDTYYKATATPTPTPTPSS